MNPDKPPWDYWGKPNPMDEIPDRPSIPWDTFPVDTTHAIWSPAHNRYLARKIKGGRWQYRHLDTWRSTSCEADMEDSNYITRPTTDGDRPPTPWHLALEGTTHALWSDKIGWYFWRVHEDGTTEHDINRTGRWRQHVDQEIGQRKLENMLRKGDAVRCPDNTQPEHHDEEGYTPMNLNNAALLVRDDITTVEVLFPDNRPDNTFTYILHNSVNVSVGDEVLVDRKSQLIVGSVSKIDQEPQINVNSNTHYRWVLANVTDLRLGIEAEIETTHDIARALKQKQAANVRDQILQQFGVKNHAELVKLGQDNQQSE